MTAGGLVFIGGTPMDDMLRAFDVETGALLWQGQLPAGGQATPMTYVWGGRQYVVIYAGGPLAWVGAIGGCGDGVWASLTPGGLGGNRGFDVSWMR